MKRVVVFTGAGISAESGIRTFRDSDGLWEQYKIEEVATPQAWQKNAQLVQDFYNQRRKQLLEVIPNIAHKALVELEANFIVNIITQNIDDLHERAGSSNVLHLHGELLKSRSTIDPKLIYAVNGWELKMGDKCEKGSQLRPHIVWFGEAVPAMEKAIEIVKDADIFLVVGSSLEVYPAASLLMYVAEDAEKWLIDPKSVPAETIAGLRVIRETAGVGVPLVINDLINRYV